MNISLNTNLQLTYPIRLSRFILLVYKKKTFFQATRPIQRLAYFLTRFRNVWNLTILRHGLRCPTLWCEPVAKIRGFPRCKHLPVTDFSALDHGVNHISSSISYYAISLAAKGGTLGCTWYPKWSSNRETLFYRGESKICLSAKMALWSSDTILQKSNQVGSRDLFFYSHATNCSWKQKILFNRSIMIWLRLFHHDHFLSLNTALGKLSS
jgi:hypothetical protein